MNKSDAIDIARNPYISPNKPVSLVGLPLKGTNDVLYLENYLAGEVFSEEKLVRTRTLQLESDLFTGVSSSDSSASCSYSRIVDCIQWPSSSGRWNPEGKHLQATASDGKRENVSFC